MDRDVTRVMGAFLIGGMIGATIALLYAPQSGRETRGDISRAARRVKRSTVDLAEDIIESVNEFAGDMKDKATDIIDRGKDLSDSAKKEIIKTLEQGQKTIEKQKKRIAESLGL